MAYEDFLGVAVEHAGRMDGLEIAKRVIENAKDVEFARAQAVLEAADSASTEDVYLDFDDFVTRMGSAATSMAQIQGELYGAEGTRQAEEGDLGFCIPTSPGSPLIRLDMEGILNPDTRVPHSLSATWTHEPSGLAFRRRAVIGNIDRSRQKYEKNRLSLLSGLLCVEGGISFTRTQLEKHGSIALQDRLLDDFSRAD